MVIALLPAVKYVLPNQSDDLGIKYDSVSLVLTVDGDMVGPGGGNPAMVELVPSDVLLSVE